MIVEDRITTAMLGRAFSFQARHNKVKYFFKLQMTFSIGLLAMGRECLSNGLLVPERGFYKKSRKFDCILN